MKSLRDALIGQADPARAAGLQRFFKTGKGEYAEGDSFLGLTVPMVRSTIRDYVALPLQHLEQLLKDRWHECRLAALLLLVHRYRKGSDDDRKQIMAIYLSSTPGINNWDLVDSSARDIAGEHARTHGLGILKKLAASANLWENRIAMVATHAFIRAGDASHTWRFAEGFLGHTHDLMHKACGWMLREAGKVDPKGLEAFLDRYATRMPRTMLRYAIERLPEAKRKAYLRKR